MTRPTDALTVPLRLVLLQVTDHGQEGSTTLLASIHTKREGALGHLHAWVRHWWEEQGHAENLPEEREAAIGRYFAFWTPEQDYRMEELVLDPAVCTECGDVTCQGAQACPACGAACHNDVTIADHGCCRDCHRARLAGEPEPGGGGA